MSNPFQDFCDSVMRAVATASHDPALFQAPFYRYGQSTFDNSEGVSAQVRWAKATTAELDPTKGAVGSARKGGEVGGFYQPFRCRVWTDNEWTTYALFLSLAEQANSLTQNQETIRVEWIAQDPEDGIKPFYGSQLEFTVTAKIPAPKQPFQLARILTASMLVSSSNSLPTSSYAYDARGTLWKDALISGSI